MFLRILNLQNLNFFPWYLLLVLVKINFHLRIKLDYKMPIQLSFFSKKTITNRKFRIRENMWWIRTLSWLCKTWARNIMSFTSLGVESTHCPFCMGLSNMFENSVLFPIIEMSKKIRWCFKPRSILQKS